MKNKYLISVEQAVLSIADVPFDAPVNWIIRSGEQWAVVGANGSGKSMLADMLKGRYALRAGCIRRSLERVRAATVKIMTFSNIHSLTDTRNAYYQQRWHATEADAMPVVGELLADAVTSASPSQRMYLPFDVEASLTKKIIHLSSGELRKFLIVRTLLAQPEILIVDNPFIGLDAASRNTLLELFGQIALTDYTQLILLVSDPADVPSMVTHVLPLAGRMCLAPQTREAFMAQSALHNRIFVRKPLPTHIPVGGINKPSMHRVTFRIENVTLRYGKRFVLNNVSWQALNGEKWALTGPNGSGKTLLLSLICADNPQLYKQTIYMFDRRRGTGESIWDVKRYIGYVSPEMHLYYMENVTVSQVVCSGFFDSIGLFRKCSETQRHTAAAWMKLFGVEQLADRLFPTLSTGEQQLALLARAFVKDPDLLVLDEPLHGLDTANKRRVLHIVEAFCAHPGKTLVYVTHYVDELPACITHRFRLT